MDIELDKKGDSLKIVIDGNIDTDGGHKLAVSLQEAMEMDGIKSVVFRPNDRPHHHVLGHRQDHELLQVHRREEGFHVGQGHLGPALQAVHGDPPGPHLPDRQVALAQKGVLRRESLEFLFPRSQRCAPPLSVLGGLFQGIRQGGPRAPRARLPFWFLSRDPSRLRRSPLQGRGPRFRRLRR